MHALLAKPIDWLAIQTARRGLKNVDCRRAESQREPPPSFAAHELITPVPDPLPAFTWNGPDAFHFPSAVHTPAPANNRVHGRLLRAGRDWTQRPTVLLLHGWNAELCYRYLFPRLAARLNRAGMNAVMFELPYHMHRRPRVGPMDDFISSDLRGMWEATRQALVDARTLLRWLEGEGIVQVGVWGFSLGAWLGGLIARSELNLQFAVLTTPIARIDRAVLQLPFCDPIRKSLAQYPVSLRELNLGTYPPKVDPRNILLVESRHDLFAPAETIEELWQAWAQPDIWRLQHGHISVLISATVIARTVEWIHGRVSRGAVAEPASLPV